jgi:alkanesulfonate monooxygenase SsuD/methylene tetrahydromethanopterin reductase-like flavin-dependent oxidoreductase (luciferase family)
MRFSIFYEIPVARPWTDRTERDAFHQVLEQVIRADELGFHAVWSVEHHFLEEFSHCSNPEVLYGAIAARTKKIRIGYGVRLAPKPYNHPVRSAESAATLDLLSDGRVYFGTGRSTTRQELEGFGIDPHETREMWQEAVQHIVGCWTNDEYAFDGKHWSMPPRRVLPKPLQKPHPPMFGATGSIDGHELMGELGMGLCSFSIGTSMENLAERIDKYRAGISRCETPLGAFVNDHVVAFTMVNCAASKEDSYAVAQPNYEWYGLKTIENFVAFSDWLEDRSGRLGTYEYTDRMRVAGRSGRAQQALTFARMMANNSVIAGDPDEVIARAKLYEEAGVDQLLCLLNPYDIPHTKVMETIELLGHHVLPAFDHPADEIVPATEIVPSTEIVSSNQS